MLITDDFPKLQDEHSCFKNSRHMTHKQSLGDHLTPNLYFYSGNTISRLLHFGARALIPYCLRVTGYEFQNCYVTICHLREIDGGAMSYCQAGRSAPETVTAIPHYQ